MNKLTREERMLVKKGLNLHGIGSLNNAFLEYIDFPKFEEKSDKFNDFQLETIKKFTYSTDSLKQTLNNLKECMTSLNLWEFNKVSWEGFEEFYVNWIKKQPEKSRDEVKRKKQVNSFLQEERPKFESLGCGYHNGVYYFGTKLWREGRSYSAIVTNNKEVYVNKRVKYKREIVGEDEIKTQFGLNYKNEFFDRGLDNILSPKAIKKFRSGDTSNITFVNVYNKFVSLLKKYIYFENETKYKLLACYRIAGFFMSVWKVRARLFLYAEMGSAKSRLTEVLHNTGFNSVSLADWTPAFLQRTIESTQGETHIDDFETLPEELKNATTRLLKTGYMRGFKAGKVADTSREPEVFNLFNTTSINNTLGLDFISNDRCITIRIPKVADKRFDQEPDFLQPVWKELRDELYILGLKEVINVSKVYPTIKSEKINGRLLSIIKPELTIAKIISQDLFNEIEEFWKQEIEQRDTKELVDDWEFRAFEKIYQIVVINNNELFFGLYEDIVEPLILEMYGEFDVKKYKLKMSTMLGNVLSRNPIFKNRKVQGRTQYKVSKEEFIQLLKAKRLYDYIANYTSTNPTDPTNSTTTTTPTTSTTPTELVGVGGVVGSERAYIPKGINKDVIGFIKKKGKVTTDQILNECETKSPKEEEVIIEYLESLVTKGILFKPQPDLWKVL